MKNKNKNAERMSLVQKTHLIIIFMLISSSINLCVVYSFTNEEKLVSVLVHCSIRRVGTSGIRDSSVATSSIS